MKTQFKVTLNQVKKLVGSVDTYFIRSGEWFAMSIGFGFAYLFSPCLLACLEGSREENKRW